MIKEPYLVLTKSREEEGHKPECPFKDNFSPSCNCDGLPATPKLNFKDYAAWVRIVDAMQKMGWSVDERSGAPAFYRKIGEHIIWVAKVASGWSHKWQRGPGWTITESSGFGTLGHCLSNLWEHVVGMSDANHNTVDELHALKLAQLDAER